MWYGTTPTCRVRTARIGRHAGSNGMDTRHLASGEGGHDPRPLDTSCLHSFEIQTRTTAAVWKRGSGKPHMRRISTRLPVQQTGSSWPQGFRPQGSLVRVDEPLSGHHPKQCRNGVKRVEGASETRAPLPFSKSVQEMLPRLGPAEPEEASTGRCRHGASAERTFNGWRRTRRPAAASVPETGGCLGCTREAGAFAPLRA